MTRAFVFPGQGSQTVSMGKDLYQNFPAAKDVFDEVDDALNQKLSTLMFDGSFEELTQTQNAQPAIMAVSLAALKAYESFHGKRLKDICSYVAGHSLGEYAALCAAGALSVSATARLLRARGTAMAQAAEKHPGKMAAIIGLSRSETESVLTSCKLSSKICVIANDNCPGQIVLSGSLQALEQVIPETIAAGAKKAVLLPVSGAFHSPLMQEAANQISPLLQSTPFKNPVLPVLSNVTARPHEEVTQIAEKMKQQITGTVRWTESVLWMEQQGVTQFIECGPGKVLSGLIKRIIPNASTGNLNTADSIQTLVL